jgi:hypothetical protein
VAHVRHRLAGLLADPVGVRLRFPGDLLPRCARHGPDVVRLLLSVGDVLVGRSLGQGQDLQGPALGVRVGQARPQVHRR